MISIKKDFDKIPEILLSDKEDAWKDKSVLDELKRIYHGKCAYCEQKTEDFHVEHYRPKSRYLWLKNEWSNLLPACSKCNASKRDSFPVEGIPVLSAPKNKEDYRANSKLLLEEEPLLIHPEIDTAENYFYFDKNGIIQGLTKRGGQTISTLNLNRAFLIEKRKELYQTFFEQLKNRITRSRYSDFYQLLLKSTEKQSEFSLLGIQLCYQFEKFLFNEVINDIEINKYKIFAEKYDKITHHEDETHANFYSELADIELIEYYKNIFNIQYKDNVVTNLKIPLSILDFTVYNFQGIKELSVNNIPLNTQWVFLTGKNGFGKTSILKAILLGLSGKPKFEDGSTDNSRIILKTVEENWMNFIPEYEYRDRSKYRDKIEWNIFGSHIFSPKKNFIAAYGSKRTDFITTDSEISVASSLFEEINSVLDTEQLLKTLEGNEKLTPFKEFIVQAFIELIPRLSRIEFRAKNGTSKEVWYYEKDDNGNELMPVAFKQLAMGMRSIIGLIGDIIQRLTKGKYFKATEGNLPQTADEALNIPKDKTPFKSLSDLHGIVIIDEFDNHLHPSWQRMLVKKLTDLFPKVQFIVSTHSAIPLLGAPPNKTVILNVNRTKEEGITVRRLEKIEKELKYLLPNQLLTSDIFGLEEIENVHLNDDELDKVPTEDNYDDIEKNKKLMKDLEERANNKELFPDNLFS